MSASESPRVRRRLWLLFSRLDNVEVPYVIPTLAWMAEAAGAEFEIYLESDRDGGLFAETGSTVIGGHHHQQFNYLCAVFDVRILTLGDFQVFRSSFQAFGLPTIAAAATAAELYAQVLAYAPALEVAGLFYGPSAPLAVGPELIRLQPYLFPEILHRRALGFPSSSHRHGSKLGQRLELANTCAAFLTRQELARVGRTEIVDRLRARDTWSTITLRLAARWKSASRGVVFGDPAAVLSQLATHCRHHRVALYAPRGELTPAETKASAYAEAKSPIATAAAGLAVELGQPVIAGRQTGDGDIFEWSRQGVCIQIVDPNRPAFPVVETVSHPWPREAVAPEEPSDAQLVTWAKDGRVLSSLIFHSGEVAHNEAMLALIELTGWTGLKLGLGAHATRYESCPQMWELIAVAREHGGAAGRVEALLHSGGRGVLAECNCPPELLAEHCGAALARIREIAGPEHVPHGYYAFMDSDFDRLQQIRSDLFQAIASQGLRYIVSSARPGRNQILWQTPRCLALNQTPRVVWGSSPFVRVTTPDDIENTCGAWGAGWLLATLDAPVIAFDPYVWRKGHRFMEVVEQIQGQGRINVLPSTIARYARLLAKRRLLPKLDDEPPARMISS